MLGHDWSISDEPICYDIIDGSDKTPWVWVRSPRLGSPIWYDLSSIHADTFRCVTTRSLRPGALCCDRIRIYSQLLSRYDMGDHDLATIGPNRHINSQADSIHLLPELLHGENYNPRPSIMAGFEVGGWQDWLRPIG